MATTRQIVLLRLISIAVLFFYVQAKSTTCAFGPNNEAPETLTCTFDIDVRQQKHGFSVQRYCPHNGEHPFTLLSCTWGEDPEPDCTPSSPGYTFNASTVSNKIFLGIDCLTSDIEGDYTCQLVPPLNGVEGNVMCPYTHRDAPKNTSCAMEPSETITENLSCTFGVNLGQTKHGFNVQRYGFKENEDPAIVLSCIWTKGVPGPRCYVAPWYTFDNSTISTNIVLQNLTKGGNYMCQLIPRVCEDNIQKPCKHDNATVKAMCVFEPNTEKPENLTCTCSGDAEQRKHNFSVHVIRYGKIPAVVLSCNWKEDQPKCNVSPGFTFDKSIVSSRIVLGIQNSTLIDLEGVYRCHVILPLGEYDINQTCSYKSDEKTTTEAPVTTVTTVIPDSLAGNEGNTYDHHLIISLVTLALIFLVIIGMVVAVHYRYFRQCLRACCKCGPGGQDDHDDPAEVEDRMIHNEDIGQDDHNDPAEVEDRMIHNEDIGQDDHDDPAEPLR